MHWDTLKQGNYSTVRGDGGSRVGEVREGTQVRGTKEGTTAQKATVHQVTTILATSKNVLFPGHTHLLTTSTDDPTVIIT